jgi:hypothetical protein
MREGRAIHRQAEFGRNQPSFNVGVFDGVTAVLSPEIRVNNITGFEVRDNRRRKIPGFTTFSLIALLRRTTYPCRDQAKPSSPARRRGTGRPPEEPGANRIAERQASPLI